MLKKTLLVLGGILTLSLAALIWRLDIPHWQRLDMEKLVRAESAVEVFDAAGAPAGTLDGSRPAEWTELGQVPDYVQNAFIAAEDLRFYRHHGIDVYRIFGALWHDLRTLSYSQGASTITQQLIKLTHLTQTKTLSRKAQELFLALQLERRMSKAEILEAYLNAVYFGHGAYGIGAASDIYFQKSVSQLTLAEGALLAGIIKSPSNYAPHLNMEKSVSRRNSILHAMAENGLISGAQFEAARADEVRLALTDEGPRRYVWYMDAVQDEAQAATGWSAEELLTSGAKIYTGLSPAQQLAAEELYEHPARFPEGAPDGVPVQSAFVAMDPATGEARALIGGRTYAVQRGLDRATDMRRQPGSAFKPVSTYAAAIDRCGYVPSSIVDDTPRAFAGGYAPGNAGGKSYGPVTLREALSRSLNIATVDLAETVGIDAIRASAERFGIELSARDSSLALSLGALTEGVSPARLCAAYCALANGGLRVEPHLIRSIVDRDGKTIYAFPQAHPRAVSAETAYMLTDMLKTAAGSGSARALSACGMPVADKTGTVAEPAGGTRDLWTAAYTPDLAVSVWMGFDQPGANHALPGSEGGGGYPARLCAAFLDAVSGELRGGDFPRPGGVRRVLLDAVSLREAHASLLSTENTPPGCTVWELFHAGSLPARNSTLWNAPAGVMDFRITSARGETPVLTFTALEENAEYVLTRASGGAAEELAVLKGKAGETLTYEDRAHDLLQPASYALMPRNARLYAEGTLLAGPVSEAQYAPGGLLNKMLGIGAERAAPMPTEMADELDQSLFG